MDGNTGKRLPEKLPYLLFIGIVLVGAFLLAARETRDPKLEQLTKGVNARIEDQDLTRNMLDFELFNLQGQATNLGSIKEKLLVLNFWGTFCTPCIDELPSFLSMAKTFEGQGLVVAAVAYDSSPEQIKRTLLEQGNGMVPYNFKVLLDRSSSNRDLKTRFGTFKIPETYLIVGNKIKVRFLGPVNWIDPKVQSLIRYLLKSAS